MGKPITMTAARRRTGVSSHTLRYHEGAGLLKRVGRSHAGRRVYQERDTQWLEMPKVLRGTGMFIRRIRQLAVMVEQGDASLEARMAFFGDWKAELERRIAFRRQALQAIDKKIVWHAAMLDDRKTGRKKGIPCITQP